MTELNKPNRSIPPEGTLPGEKFVFKYEGFPHTIKNLDIGVWTGEAWSFHGSDRHTPEQVSSELYNMTLIGKLFPL